MTVGRRVWVQRTVVWVLWVVAVLGTAGLVLERYRGGVADKSIDLTTYFLPAAQQIRGGGSPYDVNGYVYSPLVALLIAPLSTWDHIPQAWALVNLAAAVTAIALMTAALVGTNWTWQTPVLFGVSSVTLLATWPTTLVLALGQTDFMVMAALAFASWGASRRRPGPTGGGIALAALVKSWPAVVALWLFRRGAQDRRATLAWAAGVALTGIGVTIAIFGPQGVMGWAESVVKARSQPELIHFSALSIGEHLFGSTSGTVALVHNPVAAQMTSLGFGLAVAALLVTVLWRPGEPVLALWHTMLACVLLLPVSHALYLLHGLPLIWVWAARLLDGGWRTPLRVVQSIVLFGWWVLVFRVMWGDMTTGMSTIGYAVVMLSTLSVLAMSVVSEASAHREVAEPAGA